MKHRLIGVIALALVAMLAIPAYAQQTTTGTEPGKPAAQPSAPGETPTPPSESVDQPQKQQAMRPGQQPGEMAMRGAQGPEARAFQIAKMISTGGEEADRMQFQALDNHLQMLDRSMRQIEQLSGQPEQNAAEIARWASLRDEHAKGVQDVVAGYFLEQRILPVALIEPKMEAHETAAKEQPGTTTSREARESAGVSAPSEGQGLQQAYLKELQTAHQILAHTYMAKVTSDPDHVREIRDLVNNLRTDLQQYQRQVEARLNQMQGQMGQGTEQARAAEPGEPGIDQPKEQRAQREGQGTQPETKPTPPAPSTPPATPAPQPGEIQ